MRVQKLQSDYVSKCTSKCNWSVVNDEIDNKCVLIPGASDVQAVILKCQDLLIGLTLYGSLGTGLGETFGRRHGYGKLPVTLS
jgi:hypothetical protein